MHIATFIYLHCLTLRNMFLGTITFVLLYIQSERQDEEYDLDVFSLRCDYTDK